MAAPRKSTGESAEVRTRAMQAFMTQLKHPMKVEIAAVRLVIKKASPKIHERVKWDAPSFYYRQNLLAFDLRTLKSVRLLVLLPPEFAPDDELVRTDADGVRDIIFRNMTDIEKKTPALLKLVRKWVAALGPAS
ncbi:MAG: DUF1801 domain-containing protein [Gemmatimonadaceae bacterium]